MTLQASGQIAISDVSQEIGQAATFSTDLNFLNGLLRSDNVRPRPAWPISMVRPTFRILPTVPTAPMATAQRLVPVVISSVTTAPLLAQSIVATVILRPGCKTTATVPVPTTAPLQQQLMPATVPATVVRLSVPNCTNLVWWTIVYGWLTNSMANG